MKEIILTVVLLSCAIAYGCIGSLSLKDMPSDKFKNLEVHAETTEEGEMASINIVVEGKKEAVGDEAIAEVVGEAIKEGTSVLPTQ